MMFKKLKEWCHDDDEDNEKYDNADDDSDSDDDEEEEEETLFNESRDIITGCRTGVIFIMALHPGLFGKDWESAASCTA